MFGKNKSDTPHDLEAFTMFDSKMNRYWDRGPTFALNEIDMIRTLEGMYKEPSEKTKNQLFTNSEDFKLFRIGTYHKTSGTLVGQQPEHIANMHELCALFEKNQTRAL